MAIIAIFAANHLWTLGYWKRRGVPGPGGICLFGSIKDVVLMKKTMECFFRDLYSEYKSKGKLLLQIVFKCMHKLATIR